MSEALMGLAFLMTVLTWKRPHILVAIIAGLLWFGLSMWFFFAPTPIIGFTERYQFIFAGAFFLLTFLPFLFIMDTEIRKSGKKGQSWTEWGAKPSDGPKTRAQRDTEYRSNLLRRMGR
jgi:hypothetical protein